MHPGAQTQPRLPFTLRPCPAPNAIGDLDLADLVPHPGPFACTISVGSDHLSRTVDHVSNVEFVAWLDRAAELHADSLGCTRAAMLERGIMWFVARHEIDYLAEAVPGDELLVLTWVRDLRRVRSWRDTVIVRPADGALVCRAATLWVLVDLQSRRPVQVPAEMVAAFDPLTTPAARR